MEKIRISRFLAESGIASRRKSEELVLSGKVSVNGTAVTDLSFRISEGDRVEYEGKPVTGKPVKVIALNKPPGYLSTVKDDFNRKTVMDLVGREHGERLYPVGRLDYESRGLIILTNDGSLAYRITHPKFKVPKRYEVRLERPLPQTHIQKLREGIIIEGKRFQPIELNVREKLQGNTSLGRSSFFEITIGEGRKRIIRKAFKKLGYEVADLKRTGIGSFNLEGIREGKFRVLKEDEIKSLLG
jgi:23S rRNA pseudouridine2605 synthase